MTAKLTFLSEQDGYTVKHSISAISVDLDGGAPRTRATVLGNTALVGLSFFFDRFDYATFMDFWINQTFRGSIKFLVDLIIDFAQPTQYLVTAVPGSLQTNKVEGQSFQVQMSVKAEPVQFFTGVFFFTGPNLIKTPSPVTFSTFLNGIVQLTGAQINDGVHPAVDLDGIYVISSFPTGSSIALSSPSGVNPDWSLLTSYPSSTTPTVFPASVIAAPT